MILISGTVLLPFTAAWWLFGAAGSLALVTLLSQISPWFLLKRLLLLAPFVLGVTLVNAFQPAYRAHWQWLVVRSVLCLLTVILVSNTTSFNEVLRVLRRIHVPALLITTIALMHRYLFVLAEEAERMHRARASRTFTPGRRWRWAVLATAITGQLFVRSADRAERIYRRCAPEAGNESLPSKSQPPLSLPATPSGLALDRSVYRRAQRVHRGARAQMARENRRCCSTSTDYSGELSGEPNIWILGAPAHRGKTSTPCASGSACCSRTRMISSISATVFEDVAFGPRQLGLGRSGNLTRAVEHCLALVGLRGFEQREPHRLSPAKSAGSAWRACWPANRRCWCSMNPRAIWTRGAAGNSRRC